MEVWLGMMLKVTRAISCRQILCMKDMDWMAGSIARNGLCKWQWLAQICGSVHNWLLAVWTQQMGLIGVMARRIISVNWPCNMGTDCYWNGCNVHKIISVVFGLTYRPRSWMGRWPVWCSSWDWWWKGANDTVFQRTDRFSSQTILDSISWALIEQWLLHNLFFSKTSWDNIAWTWCGGFFAYFVWNVGTLHML